MNIKKEKLKKRSFRASFVSETMMCGQHKVFRVFSSDGVFCFVYSLLKRSQACISFLSEHRQSVLTRDAGLYPQGACGIAEEATPNCSKSAGVIPTIICRNAPTGSIFLSFAVLIMVVIKDTFFFPWSVILPKVTFLKRTLFLIPCSAGLFVGGICGYLRKTSNSFLWVISRFRMLSVSWCSSGLLLYSFLNLCSISFLPKRHSSSLNIECCA
jgi:hypothetical protein